MSIVTAVLFAWPPMFETSRVSLLSTLGGTTPTATPGSVRTQGLLISLEVALAVLLLTGAGLMVKSLWHLQVYPEGFSVWRPPPWWPAVCRPPKRLVLTL
jgi:putative ABC transport system permease protein